MSDDRWKDLQELAQSKSVHVEKSPGVLTGWWVHVRHNGNAREGYPRGHSFRGDTLDDAITAATNYINNFQ